ncbi:hypothetical protein ACIQXD_04960 [Streptomyces uncialis]|uniref:hypothetical protein n=1 Tax=Streptomyces uncialis TaxID=1048205 RepID=UPI00382821BC
MINSDARREALLEAVQLAAGERLTDDTGDPADEAYNRAIDDVIAALTAAATGAAEAPTTVPCFLANPHHPHGAHDWAPQPGMTPVRCPGGPAGGVTVTACRYEVSLLPVDNINHAIYAIGVEHRGGDRWAVVRQRECLGADGTWSWEPIPSERGGEWLAAHCFDLDTALRLARAAAPHVTVNGRSAAQVASGL